MLCSQHRKQLSVAFCLVAEDFKLPLARGFATLSNFDLVGVAVKLLSTLLLFLLSAFLCI